MEFNNILLCVIAAIIAILPVQFIKEYTETKNGLWLILSSVSYILLTIVYINVLANKIVTFSNEMFWPVKSSIIDWDLTPQQNFQLKSCEIFINIYLNIFCSALLTKLLEVRSIFKN